MKHVRSFYLFLLLTFGANLMAMVLQKSPQAVYAQEKTAPVITGRVMAKDDRTLQLQDGAASLTLAIPAEVELKRNAQLATINDVQVGDRVALTQNASGQITAVEVTSRDVMQAGQWFVPAVFGSIGALVLLLAFFRTVQLYARQASTGERVGTVGGVQMAGG